MDDQQKLKVREYVSNAYLAALQKGRQETAQKITAAKARLAQRGVILSGATIVEIAQIQGHHVNTLVQTRADALLDAYELYGAEIGDEILAEVKSLRAKLVAHISEKDSGLPPGIPAANMFKSMLEENTGAIEYAIACQIEQRKIAPKFKPADVDRPVEAMAIEVATGVEKQLLERVQQVLGGGPLQDKETPWYESGVLWGAAGIVVSILLSVRENSTKDAKGWLIAAFLFALLSLSAICRPLRPSRWKWRWILLVILAVASGAGLVSLHRASAASKPIAARPPANASSYSDSHSAVSDSENSARPDDDSQYDVLHLSPKDKATIDRMKAKVFPYKAALLNSPEYYAAKLARDDYRTEVEKDEEEVGCMIEVSSCTCLPKPPAEITEHQVNIDISAKMVADELSKTYVWMIENGKTTKLRVPIILFVSLKNNQATPLKIDLVYLDAKSVGGWADIRMVDSLFPEQFGESIHDKPLILQGKNGAAALKGEYLVPTLYNRVLQPGKSVEGWVAAEYPRGVKYRTSIGDMRISLFSGNRWIASKTFPASPNVYENQSFDWYLNPLDTMITEDW